MESLPKFGENHNHDHDDDDSDDDALPRFKPSVASPHPSADTHEDKTSFSSFFGNETATDAVKPKPESSLFNAPEKHDDAPKSPEADTESSELDQSEVEFAQLSSEESYLVVDEYTDERTTVVEEELERAAPDSPSAAAAHADKLLLDFIQESISSEDAEHPIDELLEKAVIDTLEKLGLSTAELSESAAQESERVEQRVIQVETTNEELPVENQPNPDNPEDIGVPGVVSAGAQSAGNARVFARRLGRGNGHHLSSGSGQHGSGSPPNGSRSGSSGNQSGNSSGAGNGSSGSGNYANHYGSAGSQGNASHNSAPSWQPNTLPTPEAHSRGGRHDLATGLLVGGVLGYLVGRRRGRIKTEKKFVKVQEKLEREVHTLQESVLQKEQQVRRLASQKVINEQPVRAAASEHEKSEPYPSVPAAEAVMPIASERTATSAEHPAALPEVNRERMEPTTSPVATHEHMQSVAPPAALSETSPAVPKKAAPERLPSLPIKPVEQMSSREAIDAADDVVVDGTSLKALHDAGRIDEKAMRRVLTEHARTGHAERQLGMELNWAEYQRAKPISQETVDRNKKQSSGLSKNSSKAATTFPQGEAITAILGSSPVQSNQSVAAVKQQSLAERLPSKKNNVVKVGLAAAALVGIFVAWLVLH